MSATAKVLEGLGLELVNEEKVNRVVMGNLGKDGALIGGLGEDASPEAIVAAYDKIGGLIRKNGDTIRTGSFYDFKGKKPHAKPQVEYVYRINGKEVYVPEGQELPGLVKAAKVLEAQEAEEAEEKPKKKKK
jgi:hypothetical protein